MSIIIGLFFCIIGFILLTLKLRIQRSSVLLDGEVIGYHKQLTYNGYGFKGYRYKIRTYYNDRFYIVESINPLVTLKLPDELPVGERVQVYFNPKRLRHRKRPMTVFVKGKYLFDFLWVFLLISGLLVLIV